MIRLSLFALISLKSFSLFSTLDEFHQELIEAATNGSLDGIETVLNRHQLLVNYEISAILLEASNAARQNNYEEAANRLAGLYEVSLFSSDSEDEGDYYGDEGDEGDDGDEDLYLMMEEEEDEGDEVDMSELPMVEIIQSSHRLTVVNDIHEICARILTPGYQPQDHDEKAIIEEFLSISLEDTDGLSAASRGSANVVENLKATINQALAILRNLA